MMTEVISSLGGPVITIFLIWITCFMVSKIAELSIIRASRVVVDEIPKDDNELGEAERSFKTYKSAVNAGFRIFHIGITAAALIAVIVFAGFMSNWAAKSHSQMDKIEQAPLPEGFKSATAEEIAVSNEEAGSEKGVAKRKEATEDNNKAMDEASKLFGAVK
jgi:hypothetical protein